MKIQTIGGSLLVLATLSACVPMEQAALTYTSRSTIGVSVEAATQETPGLDVTIGYKESNAAMVPVAVAKYCYKASKELCQNAIYQMRLISGRKEDVVENNSVQANLNFVNTEITRLEDSLTSNTVKIGALDANIAVAVQAKEAREALNALGEPIEGEGADVANERASLAATANSAPDGFDLPSARNDRASLEAAQTANNKKLDKLKERRATLTAQLRAESARGRTDAFSVYGRFSGSANGGEKGAGLTAGKVFATGIAAQNITELGGASECLTSIKTLADMIPDSNSADRIKLLASAGDICKREEGGT